jgi:hypothetical protein
VPVHPRRMSLDPKMKSVPSTVASKFLSISLLHSPSRLAAVRPELVSSLKASAAAAASAGSNRCLDQCDQSRSGLPKFSPYSVFTMRDRHPQGLSVRSLYRRAPRRTRVVAFRPLFQSFAPCGRVKSDAL